MVECKKCRAWFRDSYNLTKHMSRKKPCVKEEDGKEIIDDPKSTSENPKSTLVFPKSTLEFPKNTSEFQKDTSEFQKDTLCEFCLNNFSTKNHKNRHQKICKLKEDPVRLLEIANKIEPVLPECKLECRYCNKNLSRISILNKHLLVCKEREKYHQFLLDKQTTTVNYNGCNITNNNITNNNNNIIKNNIVINLVGQESMEHIDPERIINLLREINKNYDPRETFLTAGKLIISFDELICEKEENKNLVIPNSKCLYSEVKTPTGWKKSEVGDSLNRSFKNSAKKLYDTKESIENHNDKVFKRESNNHIFKEVKGFANKGLNYSSQTCNPDDQRKIRSGYKISKLKNNEF